MQTKTLKDVKTTEIKKRKRKEKDKKIKTYVFLEIAKHDPMNVSNVYINQIIYKKKKDMESDLRYTFFCF